MRLTILAAVAATALAAFGAVPGAQAASARYVSAGVVVARAGGMTPVDNGAVVCDDGTGTGAGGVCLPFGGGDAVGVVDEVYGEDVPFQVCVDNNGDGFCTTNDPHPYCPDEMFFSHDDDGSFYNPVGPLPTGFRPGCSGGAWRGYVVFLCEGVHAPVAPLDPHAHPVTTGTAAVTSGAEGLGTFCGAPIVSKPYYGTYTGGNLGCGMTAIHAEEVTGQNAEGTMVGGPWHDERGGPVTIRCEVLVNGTPVSSTPTGSGTGSAVTSGRATFSASETDHVLVRTVVTTNHGTTYHSVHAVPEQVGEAIHWSVPQPVL